MDPDSGIAWSGLGRIYVNEDNINMARSCYQNAVKCMPHSAIDWFNLGLALRISQKFEEAVECFEQVLEIAPDDLKAKHELGQIYEFTKS